MVGSVFSVATWQPFAATIVQGIIERYATTYQAANFAQITLVLPNRRLCKAVEQEFLTHAKAESCVIPCIMTMDDFYDQIGALMPENDSLYQQTISHEQGLLWCAAQIESYRSKQGVNRTLHESIELAKLFLSLLDICSKEQVDFTKLSSLVEEDELRDMWNISSDFLLTLYEKWQGYLKQSGFTLPTAYRIAAMQAYEAYWQDNPPQHPLIFAGTTGSILSTRQLLCTAMQYDHTQVVLGGVEPSWLSASGTAKGEGMLREREETHPHYLNQELIQALGQSPDEVTLWHRSMAKPVDFYGAVIARRNMRDVWDSQRINHSWIADNVRYGQYRNIIEESQSICHFLSQYNDGERRAIVTENTQLIEILQAQGKRYGLEMHYDAGQRMIESLAGRHMMQLAALLEDNFRAVTLLAWLKHPYTGVDFQAVAAIECEILRKDSLQLRYDNLLPLMDALWQEKEEYASCRELMREFLSWRMTMRELLEKAAPIQAMMDCHMTFLASLWKTHDPDVTPYIDQQTLLELFTQQLRFGDIVMSFTQSEDYLHILDDILTAQRVRTPLRSDEAVSILSGKEARLMEYDCLVIADMNAEHWNNYPSFPWLNESMRHYMQLRSPEVVIGQRLHDIIALASMARRVFFSRSLRTMEGVTQASSFFVRLQALCKHLDCSHLCDISHWGRALMSASEQGYNAQTPAIPKPMPAVEHRPRVFSPSSLKRLLTNPYAIYARDVLSLYALPEMDRPLEMVDFGNDVHQILYDFFDLPQEQQNLESLCALASQSFKRHQQAAIYALWMPRFTEIAKHFIALQQMIPSEQRVALREVKGSCELLIGEVSYLCKAIVDRVDINHRSGAAYMYDYKTGYTPGAKEITMLEEPQLLMIAMIIRKGGFKALHDVSVTAMLYWSLAMLEQEAGIDGVDDASAVEHIVDDFEAHLQELLLQYQQKDTPYLANPVIKYAQNPEYNEYYHLSREKEWRVLI